MKWIDDLLANNWIPDWVKIESEDWKGFQMWLQSKRKMHQKLNYTFNQNLFFSNCIQFENFLRLYTIWFFFATVYHLKTVHIIFSSWYGGIQHVGLTNKSGTGQGFEEFNLLKWVSDSVAPALEEHFKTVFPAEWQKVIMSDADSGLAGVTDIFVNFIKLSNYLQRSNSSTAQPSFRQRENILKTVVETKLCWDSGSSDLVVLT